MNKRLLLGFGLGMAVSLATVDLAAQTDAAQTDAAQAGIAPAEEAVVIRSVRAGQWNDADVWERWNGRQWTPLLPNQYPGCKALRYARVQVEHKVSLPRGLDIHVAEVLAQNEDLLLVDGELTTDIARNEVDTTSTSDVPTTGVTAPDRAGGMTAAPNPVLLSKNGGEVMVTFEVAEEYLSARLRLYDESGSVVREIEAWEHLPAGSHSVHALLKELPSGTYHLALEAPGMRRTQPLTVVK